MAKGNAIAAAVLAASSTGKGGTTSLGAVSPLVASYAQQGFDVNRPYQPLPRPADVFLAGAFGPGSPAVAMPIDPPREDTHRPDLRRAQYEVNYNMPVGTPGSEGLKLAPFATLRAAADMYSVARSCVDKRKSEILGLEWDIVPTDEAEHALMGDEKARADWEKRRAIVKDFFEHPDSDRAKYPTFGSWLNALLEDRFVCDAVAVHLVPPRRKGAGPFGSDLASLDVIDGTMIRPMLNTLGATPKPPSVGYQAYDWGVPRVDLMSVITEADLEELPDPVAAYRADQLIYIRETPRAWTPYGFSCIEKALLPISIGLARQQFQADYFNEGSIPGQFITPGPDIATPGQIRQLQDALNAMAGDIGAKHRIIVLPPGSKAEAQKPVALADQFDEWIVSQITMPFGLTPMDLGITPRVSAVQTPSESRELSQINSDKGSQTRIEPVTSDLKAVLFDYVIQQVFKQKDMQFSWGLKDRGKNRDAIVTQGMTLTEGAVQTIDEMRIDLGKTPFGLPETSVPMVRTATGFVPLSAIGSETETAPGQLVPGQQDGQPPQVTDEELTTPAHEAARQLPDTPGSGDVQDADAQKQAAELEILTRYLRKGRGLASFRPAALPAEALAAAAAHLPQGIPAAVKAAGDAARAKRRQDRRDRKLEAAAGTVAARLGQLVHDHKHSGLSMPHLVDGGVRVLADGYRHAIRAGAEDAAGDYPDTPLPGGTAIDGEAQEEAEGQRGYLAGLLRDVIAGLSLAAIGARLALYASTLTRAYSRAYGTTVTSAHPDYEIIWELGDNRDHCRLCVARDGQKFTVDTLPGWPGDGGFGPGGICEGGPNCHCSVRFAQGGQTMATGTNTQLPAAPDYYAQQNAAITAARQTAAANRQAFTDSLPDGPSLRAATRDELRAEIAALANERIRAAGGYPGVSVEPSDVPAWIIAQMLPPGLEGAAGLYEPRIDVVRAVEEMFAAKGTALDMTKTAFTVVMAGVLKDTAAAIAGPAADPQAVHDQLARNYRPEGIAWVLDVTWTGPAEVPLDLVHDGTRDTWAASEPGPDTDHVGRFEHRIDHGGGDVRPVIMVRVPGHRKLRVVDGHHRYLGYKRAGQPVKAYVGTVTDDSADAAWAKTHLYQIHSGGDPLNKRAKVSKESVRYRPATDQARSCGTCVMYRGLPPGSGSSRCTLVEGTISADATCDRWSPAGGTAKGGGPGEDPTRVAFLLLRAPNEQGKWRYLLHKRDDQAPHGGTWGLPGGKTHDGESPWDAAVREASEELGDLPPALKPAAVWSRTGDSHVTWTYLVSLPAIFTPAADGQTSGETAGWGWFRKRDVAGLDLHPAMRDTWEGLDFGDDRLGGRTPEAVKAASGYSLNPRSGMISLDVPAGLVSPVPGGVSDHHITVVYLGPDVGDDAFAEACRRAALAASAAPGPLAGVISGIGTFPASPSSDGRIPAWASVTLPGADQLRADLEDLSASEHKQWRPHMTLAYCDDGDQLPGPVPATPVDFTHLSVHRGSEVARFTLGGTDRPGEPHEGDRAVCPCGTAAVYDALDAWQHADGSVSHDDGESVSGKMQAAEASKMHKSGNAQTLRNWYNAGAGGAVSWGSHGDFEACVAVAGRHLGDPEGYCAERHHEVTGEWPGPRAHRG